MIAREELEHELDSKHHTIRLLQKQLVSQEYRQGSRLPIPALPLHPDFIPAMQATWQRGLEYATCKNA